VTGLPDAYGRGRIIGDYRRVALYGVDFLIADKEREKQELDDRHSTEDIIRLREELAEQIRSLKELKEMASRYGYDISGPATSAREAVQWTYFGYLAAIKQQNGAAMSAGRLSTFWDIYFEREIRAGTLTESQAQEIIDDLVIKWRIVRFLRAPEYNELFSGDPVWVTEVVGGMGEDGRTLSPRPRFACCTPSTTLDRRPSPTSRSSGRRDCPRASSTSPSRRRSIPAPSSTSPTTSCGPSGVTTAPSPAACRRCGSASRCSSSARG